MMNQEWPEGKLVIPEWYHILPFCSNLVHHELAHSRMPDWERVQPLFENL